MPNDIREMTDDAYENWIRHAAGQVAAGADGEAELISLLSNTLRMTDAKERARSFVEAAGLCLAMADKSLGFQGPVANCLVLNLQ